MNPFADLRAAVIDVIGALVREGGLPPEIDAGRITVEPPREAGHGDAATNAALVLARPARRNPMELAGQVAGRLATALPQLESAEVARPGFINLRLRDSFWREQVRVALRAGADYGAADVGRGEAVNVEYCSANPTGPLHVGHGRGTVFGDALANLLARTGYRVTREFYVNDGGAQIDALARSVHLRYREALGEDIGPIPEGLYPGDYLIPVGREIAERDGRRWHDAPDGEWLPEFRRRAVAAMMVLIRGDLEAVGVRFDVFTSEAELIAAGRIDEALEVLDGRGLLYTGTLPPPKGKETEDWEPRPQLLFRSTAFGDDVDRPLRRSNGAWTYFAADLAYHLDKYRRGSTRLIDVLGADHGGYVRRMQAGVTALSDGRASLDAPICQLVNLLDAGQPLRMSKRAGRIFTLRDLVDEVGRDVVRFIMLTRKNDAPLDFDIQRVTEQSKDNPVFYVQYAHARICSVFRNAAEAGLGAPAAGDLLSADLDRLRDPAELALIKQLASYPRVLEGAAHNFEPHRVAFYLYDLAAAFHGLWTQGKEQPSLRFLRADDERLTRARLAMIAAVRTVLAAGLGIIGVAPVEELH
ncbi:MAG TPA: arginine--tRNA ligase [Geminicoccaceae bacterium]|nr:arginine--tRNA ligase [Geminicoccaceae bacterium]